MKEGTFKIFSSLVVGILVALGGAAVAHAETAEATVPGVPTGLQGPYVPHDIANDPSCTPSAAHPYPVIFIHGTTSNANTWTKAITELNRQGFCSWVFNYGMNDISQRMHSAGEFGNEDINKSARDLSRIVDYVREVTGQEKVSLVGHSQGATLMKIYLQEYGGAEKVYRSIGLSGTYHGTTLKGLSHLLRPLIDVAPLPAAALAGTASTQQVVGSREIQHLNSLPDTDPRVIYTNVYTPVDRIATPNSTSQLVSVDGADVANINLSQACSLTGSQQVSHEEMPLSSDVIGLVLWGLTRARGETQPQITDCASL